MLTGLRGVGKTVLLDTFKPLAIKHGWIWVGTDLSESASVTEEALATRLMAHLAVATSSMVAGETEHAGFAGVRADAHLDFEDVVPHCTQGPRAWWTESSTSRSAASGNCGGQG